MVKDVVWLRPEKYPEKFYYMFNIKPILISGGDTCINPDVHTTKMPNIPWRKRGDGWFSNLRGGFKVIFKRKVISKKHHSNSTKFSR